MSSCRIAPQTFAAEEPQFRTLTQFFLPHTIAGCGGGGSSCRPSSTEPPKLHCSSGRICSGTPFYRHPTSSDSRQLCRDCGGSSGPRRPAQESRQRARLARSPRGRWHRPRRLRRCCAGSAVAGPRLQHSRNLRGRLVSSMDAGATTVAAAHARRQRPFRCQRARRVCGGHCLCRGAGAAGVASIQGGRWRSTGAGRRPPGRRVVGAQPGGPAGRRVAAAQGLRQPGRCAAGTSQ